MASLDMAISLGYLDEWIVPSYGFPLVGNIGKPYIIVFTLPPSKTLTSGLVNVTGAVMKSASQVSEQ